MHTKFWSETLTGRDHTEDLSVDERILLEWILRKWGGEMWMDSSGSGYGTW